MHSRLIPFFLAVSLWFSQAHGETIQLTRENQRFLIPVLVNGAMRLHFTLDTGADSVIIPVEVLLTLLHTRTVAEADIQLGEQVYTLADGREVKYQKIRLKSVQLGSFEVEDLEASVGPPGSSLLLGGSFTNLLGKWSLDPQAATLTFESRTPVQVCNDEGNRLQGEGEHEAAVKAYSRALEIDPQDANILYNRATSYNDLEQYELALSDIRKACQLDPSDALNHFRKGDIEDNLERYSEAIVSYTTSLRINPNFDDAWAYRGYTYYKMKKDELARSDFDQALQKNGDNYLARRWRGQQFYDAEKYQRARQDFDVILKSDPEDFEVLALRANCHYFLNDSKSAIRDFDACIAHDPKDFSSRFLRGLIRWESKQARLALADFNAYIEAEPKYWAGYYYRALTQLQLGERQLALKDLRVALKLAESDEDKKQVQEAIRRLTESTKPGMS